MHKYFGALALVLMACISTTAHASADRQSFFGFGPGVEVLSQNGSGTGFYIQGLGGYNFNTLIGLGLHAGYSKVGGVGIGVFDYGGFVQLTDGESGLYGKLYLDGVTASVDGGGIAHGVNGTQTGFAPGIAAGALIPSAGSFHMVPEVAYRVAFLNSPVNLITATFNFVWDY